MTTIALKKKIHECIDTIEDGDVLEAVYTILNAHNSSNDYDLSEADLKVIEERKKAVKKGEEKLYTVSEVKKKILKNLKK